MDDIRTVQLGQFTDDNAERIAAALQAAGIPWWHKAAGRFVRFLSAADWGTRIYVDATRLEDARRVAAGILEERARERQAEQDTPGVLDQEEQDTRGALDEEPGEGPS